MKSALIAFVTSLVTSGSLTTLLVYCLQKKDAAVIALRDAYAEWIAARGEWWRAEFESQWTATPDADSRAQTAAQRTEAARVTVNMLDRDAGWLKLVGEMSVEPPTFGSNDQSADAWTVTVELHKLDKLAEALRRRFMVSKTKEPEAHTPPALADLARLVPKTDAEGD